MTAAELIERLKQMPPTAEVFHLWDGCLRTAIEHVWLAHSGVVATADHDQVCYKDGDRPADAPTSKQQPYWHTPRSPDEPEKP